MGLGASAAESSAAMPGDESVPDAQLVVTRARDIAAPPERVWPWLVQMGAGRGGFYSYDSLERLIGMKTESAEAVLSEHQALKVGDTISFGPWQNAYATATTVDCPNVLAMRLRDSAQSPFDWSWSFVVSATGGGSRLIVRARYRWERRALGPAVRALDLGDAIMTRRMLKGIAERAERTF